MSQNVRLLFVCSGNIVRSPMAEAMARAYAGERGRSIQARSAGTLGLVDQLAHPKAVAVCAELGIDLTPHRSQGVSPELVEWADYVLVMEYAHAAVVRELAPEHAEKTLLLGSLVGRLEIADPIGTWFKGRYRQARDMVRQAVEAFIDRLPAEEPPRGLG